jgi:hypothetical protein
MQRAESRRPSERPLCACRHDAAAGQVMQQQGSCSHDEQLPLVDAAMVQGIYHYDVSSRRSSSSPGLLSYTSTMLLATRQPHHPHRFESLDLTSCLTSRSPVPGDVLDLEGRIGTLERARRGQGGRGSELSSGLHAMCDGVRCFNSTGLHAIRAQRGSGDAHTATSTRTRHRRP